MKRYIRLYAEEWESQTGQLTDAEKGQLVDALMLSVATGQQKAPSGNARFAFSGMISRIWREINTHEKKREEREAKRNDRKGIQGS